MAPQQKFEFVIIKLSYSPQLRPQFPRITLKRKRNPPIDLIPHLQHWFGCIMKVELPKIPPHLTVHYYEWEIISGDEEIFTIFDYRFPKVTLVLGEDNIYWSYNHKNPKEIIIEGCNRLIDSYCSCCIYKQYLKIMQGVKGYAMRTGDS